jgi:hypothetical protein
VTEAQTFFESGGEEPPPGSQPWTMEYVARLFIEGGGFQGIADTHNAGLERAKAETEAHLIVMPPVESTATFGSILGHVRH